MPIWDQMPDVAGQALTLDAGLTATANAQFGDFTYTTANGAVTITGYTGAGGDVEIPAQIEGLPVTAIGNSAFSGKAVLTSITIPLSVTNIGNAAFQRCTGLTTVTIPASVTSLGSSAFSGCTGLTTVTIPASVTSLGSSAFSGCIGLTTVTIPASVTSINSSAFYGCTGLTSVTIPLSVTSIGSSAFYGCTGLTSVTIPASVISIASSAFSGCTKLTNIAVGAASSAYTSLDGVLYNKSLTTLIRCPEGKDGAITIPASVTSFDSSAFSGCTKLANIDVGATNTTYASLNGVLYNKSLTTLIKCPRAKAGAIVIPASVTSIGDSAFAGCTGLTNITIPASVTDLGSSAFGGCTGLTSVTIPTSVTSLGSSAFSGCIGLTTVTIPGSVTSIGSSAFSGCTGLTSVTIAPGVTSIGNSAFDGCAGLTSVAIPASVITIERSSFFGFDGGKLVQGNGCSVFFRCNRLSSITVESSNAAYTSVDGVLYDKSVTSLVHCPAGKAGAVVVPSSVTDIGGGAFFMCNSLTSVTIPPSVASISSFAFSYCSVLEGMFFLGPPPILKELAFVDPTFTVFRLADANGWSRTYGGAPVQIFQPIEVAAGQKVTVSTGASVDRVLKKGTGAAVLSTASTRTGGTVVEAGELVVRQKDALGVGLLEVQAGAKATFQAGYDTVAVTSLSLAATSRLELGTSKLSIATNGFTESEIRSKLIAGRNGGSWDGTNGITSTSAGGDRAIGYRVADGALEVAYAAPGDSNLDGVIDILDIGDILSAGKFNTGEPANWTQGDTNYDNVFDIVDLADILGTGLFNQGNYLIQGAASSAAVETSSVATLDPALVFAALAMDPVGATTTKRKSS